MVPIEIVVNVDSPDEAAVWANLSAATHGLVVPILSDNIHEVRGYNRMAHVARGDICECACPGVQQDGARGTRGHM